MNRFFNKTIFVGILLALFSWFAESFLHILFAPDASFVDDIFPSDMNELRMRTLIMGMIIGFTLYLNAKNKWDMTFNSIPFPIFVHNNEFKIIKCNKAYQEISGMPLNKIINKPYYEIFPKMKEPHDMCKEAIKSSEYRIEEDIFILDINKTFKVSLCPVADIYGRYIHSIHIMEDITERKKAEDALKKSEASLAKAQKIAHIGNWDWDIVRNELSWSDEIYRIFGLTPNQFGATYEAFLNSVHPDDREFVKVSVYEALHKNKPYSIAHRIVLPNGQERIVREQAEVVFDRTGKAARMSGTVQDITEQKMMERQLMQSQKMEAVGQLAGGIAHDFNNIMTAIIGYGSLLIKKRGGDELLKNYVGNILSLSERAASLTRDLLVFSRKIMINPQPVDLNDLITKVERILLRVIREDVEIKTNFKDKNLTAKADPIQMEQVLMNLATNARDAMPGRGTISINTDIIEIDNEFINAHGYGKAGMYALITFADTGVGIDKETQKKIFEPFFTTKEVGKGTGLGLAMVYSIIKQHNGYVNVYSEPGRGTIFRIYLPMEQEILLDKKESRLLDVVQKWGAAGNTETVLLVEDEKEVRKITKTILEEFGYKVIEAVNGEDAVNKFIENKDKIQLLVLDIIMPKKNGKEAYEEIKKISPDVKVIFMSGYYGDMIKAEDISNQGLKFISKPVTPNEFLRTVREVIDG